MRTALFRDTDPLAGRGEVPPESASRRRASRQWYQAGGSDRAITQVLAF
jgi:hypothetical protein